MAIQNPYSVPNTSLGTLLTLTAASAGGNSAVQTNSVYRGVSVAVNITAITGTSPTLTVTIQGQDPVSGAYYTVLESAALSATGLTILTVRPGIAASANVAAAAIMPLYWRILYAIGGTTPAVTATVGAVMAA